MSEVNAVIYARFSSDNQREESIDGQIRVCTEYAESKGYKIVNHYIDRAMSGTNDRRPSFQQMISDSEKKLFNMVIVYKTDRFSRNRYDSAIYKTKLKKNEVAIEYACEPNITDNSSILVTSLLEGFAEFYSKSLSENTCRGKKENALKGKLNGGVTPFAYRHENGQLVINEDEAAAVRFIFQSYIDGIAYSDILASLKNRYGIVKKMSGLKTLLQNEVYTGIYKYTTNDGEQFSLPDHHSAIISQETFRQAEERRLQNKRCPNKDKGKKRYMLSGIVHCGECGAPYIICHSYRKGVPMYYRLYCLNRKDNKSCDNTTKKMEVIENIVIQAIKKNVLHKSVIKELSQKAYDLQENKESGNIQELKKELGNIQKAKNNIILAIEQGIFTPTTKERLNELEQAEADIQIKMAQEQTAASSLLSYEEIESFLFDYCKGNFEDNIFRCELCKTFVKDVLIYKDTAKVIMNAAGVEIVEEINIE